LSTSAALRLLPAVRRVFPVARLDQNGASALGPITKLSISSLERSDPLELGASMNAEGTPAWLADAGRFGVGPFGGDSRRRRAVCS